MRILPVCSHAGRRQWRSAPMWTTQMNIEEDYVRLKRFHSVVRHVVPPIIAPPNRDVPTHELGKLQNFPYCIATHGGRTGYASRTVLSQNCTGNVLLEGCYTCNTCTTPSLFSPSSSTFAHHPPFHCNLIHTQAFRRQAASAYHHGQRSQLGVSRRAGPAALRVCQVHRPCRRLLATLGLHPLRCECR
ncbi:unnamed protein product [Chondrus crispus]|uniref:Uncharacterized protein n=1 Tax=Chondrus crispus TaxID=2769 RepID=R7QBP9_CHOCR|nr:unnamed protein product [Chondrus crispus]CDF34890.1 unnamed protein product [Chondrus crispus]|eukprot:XP_005714709.1 unnamed protein product [Chondrus crispus]